MSTKQLLMYSALLHDVGKIVSRSDGEEASHAAKGKAFLQQFDAFQNEKLLENIAYHDKASLEANDIATDSLAYIIAMANDITRGIDHKNDASRSSSTNERVDQPLHSVFNMLDKDKGKQGVFPFQLGNDVPYPTTENVTYKKEDYQKLTEQMKKDFATLPNLDGRYFASLLQWLEKYTTYIPHDVSEDSLLDISLYDHSKITCAIATNIYDVLIDKNEEDYRKVLFSNGTEENFYDEDLFLLASLDMSGIQDFIYLISGSQALKGLRTRSFYIELMLEVIVDELLDRLKLSRANLLYTGGGHAYLLLPNTHNVITKIEEFHQDLKAWFLKEFTTDISASIAYVPCSGNDLMNENGNYRSLWRNVTQKLSEQKAKKYTPQDIMNLNNKKSGGERECVECLRSDTNINVNNRCTVCQSIISISNKLRDHHYFIVKETGELTMPFGKKLSVIDETAFQSVDKQEISFLYTKNANNIKMIPHLTANLWMCDYDFASMDEDTRLEGIASYANRKVGVKRLGVMRADIDNLGAVFIQGIPGDYQSISRTTTLSRQLSIFFKNELRNLLEGSKVTVIYSGGDDIFFIGAWDDVVEKAVEVRKAFGLFTMDKLTFSAGIGIFPAKYPVSKMAEETGRLEEVAKQGEKNQLTVWLDDRTYNWNKFETEILTSKVPMLHKMFARTAEHGKTFAYHMLHYFRESNELNIARFAYLLARTNINDEDSKQLFDWIRDENAREYFIKALEYYIYEIREVE